MLFHVGAPKIDISIHALRKESDPSRDSLRAAHVRFQSTLSVRRATEFYNTVDRWQDNFNPRSP